MTWSEESITRIKYTQILILQHKLLMNFIIDRYNTKFKRFNIIKKIIAYSIPMLLTAKEFLENSNGISFVTVTLGYLVAGLVKASDYIKYDRTRDIAREQTTKYTDLYNKIDRELSKSESKKQDDIHFITWIERELAHIELDNPEIKHKEKEQFIQLCKAKGITYKDDIEKLRTIVVDSPRSPDMVCNKQLFKKTVREYNEEKDISWIKERLQHFTS